MHVTAFFSCTFVIDWLAWSILYIGALCELWEQTGRQGDSKTERLRDELTTLRQQLHVEHATLKNRDTQLASLREKVKTYMYM